MNEGFGKDFYRKGNSVKRSGPFSEPPDSENWKVVVQIYRPKIGSYFSQGNFWSSELPLNKGLFWGPKAGIDENPITKALFVAVNKGQTSNTNFFLKIFGDRRDILTGL